MKYFFPKHFSFLSAPTLRERSGRGTNQVLDNMNLDLKFRNIKKIGCVLQQTICCITLGNCKFTKMGITRRKNPKMVSIRARTVDTAKSTVPWMRYNLSTGLIPSKPNYQIWVRAIEFLKGWYHYRGYNHKMTSLRLFVLLVMQPSQKTFLLSLSFLNICFFFSCFPSVQTIVLEKFEHVNQNAYLKKFIVTIKTIEIKNAVL